MFEECHDPCTLKIYLFRFGKKSRHIVANTKGYLFFCLDPSRHTYLMAVISSLLEYMNYLLLTIKQQTIKTFGQGNRKLVCGTNL